jgi:hypothetical protein
MKICALALATLIGGVSAAAGADDIYAKYFSGVNDGKPCYARNYDDAHLKSHPKQKVRQIEVDFDQGWRSDESARNTAADFHAGISFMLKTSTEWYGQQLYCKIGGNGFDCYLDADGGRIRLTPAGANLKLEVTTPQGIAVEGEKDAVEFGKPGSDDRVFILMPANRKICDDASK